MEKVDADDVFRVHQQYFLAFLKNEKRCTVLTCNKSQHKTLLESFKKMNVQISTQTLFDIINPLQKQKQFKKGKK